MCLYAIVFVKEVPEVINERFNKFAAFKSRITFTIICIDNAISVEIWCSN